MIFHIVQRREWAAAKAHGGYAPPSLQAEGFIHCSAREQVVETANLYYRGERDLVVLCIDPSKLSAPLKFEAPAGGHKRSSADFPHIYGTLNLEAVVATVDFPGNQDGTFALPSALNHL